MQILTHKYPIGGDVTRFVSLILKSKIEKKFDHKIDVESYRTTKTKPPNSTRRYLEDNKQLSSVSQRVGREPFLACGTKIWLSKRTSQQITNVYRT